MWILDSLGELMALYGLADIVVMGGSFSDIGGHNPLEPAWFKKPIIVGPNMSNFSDIMQQMLSAEAVIQLPENENNICSLTDSVTKLLVDNDETKKLGDNAQRVVMMNQGAVNISLEKIKSLAH